LVLIFSVPSYYIAKKVKTKYAERAQTEKVDTVSFASGAAHQIFYVGASSLRVGFESLVWASAFRESPDVVYTGQAPLTGAGAGLSLLIACLTIGAVGYGGFLAVKLARRKTSPSDKPARLLIVTAATIVISVIGISIAHFAVHFPFPELRTGLYWIPLVTLASVAHAAQVHRGLKIALCVVFAGIIFVYAAGFQTRYYLEWRYCAATRPIMEKIKSIAPVGSANPLRIGATWQLEPSLNFYRDMFHLDWLEELQREPVEKLPRDFYVLIYADRALASKRHLRVLLDDPISGAVLALPPKEIQTTDPPLRPTE
jgi:hypothetical protein